MDGDVRLAPERGRAAKALPTPGLAPSNKFSAGPGHAPRTRPREAPHTLDIKRATEADAGAYTRLQTDTWRETYTGIVSGAYLDSLDPADSADSFLRGLADGGREFYIARAEGQPAGRLVLAKPQAGHRCGELQAFYLLRAFQGQGAGRQLMDFALDRFWTLGCECASLWVLEGNKRAIGFYEHMGFAATGLREPEDMGGRRYTKLRYTIPRPDMSGRLYVREAAPQDLPGLLGLYAQLHEEPPPEGARAAAVWQRVLRDPNHHVLVAQLDGALVASCVLLIVPNLTRGARPYALIENVVTHRAFRRRGFGRAVLQKAVGLAIMEHCYKAMLMTGRRQPGVLRFYEQAGFSARDKTAFVRRFD